MLLLVVRRAIQQLTKKVAELEAGLTALLSGQAIPPAAAAALIAAISRIRSPAGGAAGQSKPGSQGGSGRPLRNRSEGADVEAGGIQVPNTAAPASPAAVKLTEKQLRQQQDLQERADELDSVIKAINEVKLMCPNSVLHLVTDSPCGPNMMHSCANSQAWACFQEMSRIVYLLLVPPSLYVLECQGRHQDVHVYQARNMLTQCRTCACAVHVSSHPAVVWPQASRSCISVSEVLPPAACSSSLLT